MAQPTCVSVTGVVAHPTCVSVTGVLAQPTCVSVTGVLAQPTCVSVTGVLAQPTCVSVTGVLAHPTYVSVTGVLNILAAAGGTLTGGIVTSRFKLSPRKCLKLLVAVSTVSSFLMATGFFLGCDQPHISMGASSGSVCVCVCVYV